MRDTISYYALILQAMRNAVPQLIHAGAVDIAVDIFLEFPLKQERGSTHMYVHSPGTGFPANGKTIHSLRRDIAHPSRDLDYRGISLFPAYFHHAQKSVVRVFNILRSLCGETILKLTQSETFWSGVRMGFSKYWLLR